MTKSAFSSLRTDPAGVDVSIIMPVFNTEEFVHEAVASVLGQSNASVELIVIDDASTDGSLDAVRAASSEDPRVHIVSLATNRGVSVARNHALGLARGRFVLFLDSDDTLRPDAASLLVSAADAEAADLIYFDAETVLSMSDPPHTREQYDRFYSRAHRYSTPLRGPELFAAMLENEDWRPSACLQLVRRELIEASGIRFPDGLLHEDNLFSAEVILAARRAFHVPERLYRRRIRSGSITSSPPTDVHVQSLLAMAERFDQKGESSAGLERSLLHRMADRMRSDAASAREQVTPAAPTRKTPVVVGVSAPLLRRLAARLKRS